MKNKCRNTVARWLVVLSCILVSSLSYAADEIVFFHSDTLGSATMAYNESGELCWAQHYTPYGEKSNSDDVVAPPGCGLLGGERGYTGHVQDSTGLVYAQQRYYDPTMMRFLSLDPAGVVPEEAHTFNRYSYAANNPYKYNDPDGRIAETVWDVANLSIGLASLSYNIYAGNYGSAIIDVVGLGVDAVLTAIPIAPAGAGMAIQVGRKAGETGNYVYRALRPGEDITKGLSARMPGANTKIGSHVMNKRDSDLISTTRDIEKALGLFNSGNGVVRIDLDKVTSEVIDVSNGFGAGRVYSRTKSHQEVLIRDGGNGPAILPAAIDIVTE